MRLLERYRGGLSPFALFWALFFMCHALGAAPAKRYAYDEDNFTAMREIKDGLDILRHEVGNHETEIRMFEEKITNQEASVDSLRKLILDTTQANKDLVKTNTSSVEGRIANLESTNKSLVADLQQLKNHANDTAAVLVQYKQKLGELEKILNVHSQNMDNLQTAMHSLMDALQVKEGAGGKGIAQEESGKVYRIKTGDSLEKIARLNGTTVKAIKEINNMATDRIVVGQTIQLP